jgi:signal transduction histidine kinase
MLLRQRTLALLAVGIALGAAAEWLFHASTPGLGLIAADFVVGIVLIVCGLVAWERRPESRCGLLMLLAGSTWFLGNLSAVLVYLHRGPLVQLLLSYPTGRLRSRLAKTVVVLAYVDAAVEPLARSDWLTLALATAVAFTAIREFAGGPVLAAALVFSGALAVGAVERLNGAEAVTADLWVYDAAIVFVAIVLLADVLRAGSSAAVVTGLVVDLGTASEAGPLRSKLARALGDPSLVIGYRYAGTDAFFDDAGRPVELPPVGTRRTITPLVDDGEQVAVLVHDESLLEDARLLDAVAAAARIAVANAALQVEARRQAEALQGSRRRIVEVADAQSRRVQEELRQGAGHRLAGVAALLLDARTEVGVSDDTEVRSLERALGCARRDLEELARGVHPAALTEGGLVPALAQLAERATVPVGVRGDVGRLPSPVESALFFVCSEALANVAKHAAATRVTIDVRTVGGCASVVVIDDGIGGADPACGSGLRGLADRVEALGGKLGVATPDDGGTSVTAEIPYR